MGQQLFTASGSWNWPTGVTSAVAEAIGGAGAGGGATGNPANGGGGKGGGYAKKTITKGAESSLTVNVGTGGVGGTTANGAAATVSSVVQGVTTVLTATAGVSAAAGQTTTTGAGSSTVIGTAVGDVTFNGGNGAAGGGSSSGAGGGSAGPGSVGGNATTTTGGTAGTGTFANGSTYQVAGRNGVAASSAGTAGIVYGGAGSGGAAGGAADRAGGSGAAGMVLITWVDPVASFAQADFRFYADGTEAGSTALAAQGTNYTAAISEPTYFVKDNFTDTDGTDLTAHTGETGATWATPSYLTVSSPKITSNRARTVNDIAFAYASGAPPSADYTVEALFRQITDEVTNTGIIARLDTTADNHYIIRYVPSSDEWQLRRTLAGSAISLGTYSEALSNGDERRVKLVVSGSNLEVFIDGVSRITATNSEVTGAGQVAMRHTALAAGDTTGVHIDWIRAY